MTSTKDSSKAGPIWKTQSNRVQGAIWKHSQKGETRYTVAISRSYYDKKAGDWKNVFFYDEQDLDDVDIVRKRAKEYLDPIETDSSDSQSAA